jgi:hypothetical protein
LILTRGLDDKNPKPGEWYMETGPGEAKAIVVCPKCGHWARLNHEIAEDGTVTPSLICPYACGWHDWVKLEGWRKE